MIGESSATLRVTSSLPGQRRGWQSRRRARHQPCRAEVQRNWTAPGKQSQDDVLERIKKAREYKRDAQGQTAGSRPAAVAAAAAPPSPATTLTPSAPKRTGDVEQAFSQAAQQLAANEEAKFLQAVSEVALSNGASSSASSSSGVTLDQAASHADMLARMDAARRYKQQKQKQQPPSGISSSSKDAVSSGSMPASSGGATSSTAGGSSSAQAQHEGAERQRSFRTGSGSADQAANWLRFADKADGGGGAVIDPTLSPEQFTLAKEERKKQQEVELITGDASWTAQVQQEKAVQQEMTQGHAAAVGDGAPGQPGELLTANNAEEGANLHKPKVATWGVFPRPRNISEAYGGGRNLRPGQALESEEAAREREQRVSTALRQYRKTLGLDVDPQVEAQAQALYNEGSALFEQGLISAALPKFAAAAEVMALRSRLGGEARLQQAICLDSLGCNQEAYDIYKGIENHPAPGVAKKAKRMLFGWKAAENLKTTRLSYAPTTAQWKRYFDAFNRGAAYAAYSPSDKQEEQDSDGVAVALALGVMLLPIGLVAWRALLF